MRLSEMLDLDLILPELKAAVQNKAFEEMAGVLSAKLGVEAEKIVHALADRESTRSTALEKTGVAIPHARLNGATKFSLLVARSKKGIDFHAEDGKPSHLFFIILGPENKPGDYLRLLARVARLCHSEDFRSRLLAASTAQQMRDIILEQDEKG